MASINISLPDSLRKFLDEQVKKCGFATASEYLRELLRAAQRRAFSERVDQFLLAGLASPARKMTDKDWQRIHKTVRERLPEKK